MSEQKWREVYNTAQVDGTAHVTAAAISIIPAAAKWTLPNNFFEIGRKLRIWAAGRMSQVVTTPGTMRFDVRLGGTVVFDSLAIALDPVARTNMPWELEINLTCRAIGATANLMGVGKLFYEGIAGAIATPPKGVLVAMLPWNTAPAVGGNFDSTSALAVDLQFTQTVATHSLTLHQCEIEGPN